jgi:hypothetical protein
MASRSVRVGVGAGAIAVDGSEVWVARSQAGTVTRIVASRRDVFRVGGAPVSLALGFGKLWAALRDADEVISIAANDRPQNGRARLRGATIPVPVKVVAWRSQLWALSLDASALYPLDPAPGTAGEPVYSPVGDPIDMAPAGDELWLLGAHEGEVSPVNASLGRIVRSGFDLRGRSLSGLSASGSTVWLGEPGRDALLRIDAGTVAVSELGVSSAVRPDVTAVGQCGVWVASRSGMLEIVDPRSGASIVPPVRAGRSVAALAPSGAGVWLSDPRAGALVYVSERPMG